MPLLIEDKYTLTTLDIQKIIGCGRNAAYSLVSEAYKNDGPFIVKKIGVKFYIPSKQFFEWYNSPGR